MGEQRAVYGLHDEHNQWEEAVEHPGVTGRELTESEVIAEIQRMREGVESGTVPVFVDAESAQRQLRQRSSQ